VGFLSSIYIFIFTYFQINIKIVTYFKLSQLQNISDSSKYRSCEVKTAATKTSNLTEKIKIVMCIGVNC